MIPGRTVSEEMTVELKVPEVGESITEVQIGEWLKKEGDWAERDEAIVVIETDKVSVEVLAPEPGRISQALKKTGDSAQVGDVVGYLDASADAPESGSQDAPEIEAKSPSKNGGDGDSKQTTPQRKTEAKPQRSESSHVMPAANRALATHGLKPQDASPSGPGGRLLKEDVERAAKQPKAPAPAEGPRVTGVGREEEIVPMSPLRRMVARRLVEAQQTAALLTTFNEIDMTEVKALRGKHKDAFLERYGVKLGFMSFFVKAVIDALRQQPEINAEVRGTEVVYRNYYDIGIAVGGGKGLVVPVIRNAELLSFAEVESTIGDYAARAQKGQLELRELQGGTFTISNGGVYGSLLSTPIVNPPQSAILGLHAIQDRPIALNGEVVIRPMMYVALTYDHRIVDGREAVTFLRRIKDALEEPARLLLEI
ncbi:MAG: 2-oxoglutarate dehydrogenase complex dihydrolipoyllysine-residue succinyltransferase [Planctomycetota bacterium]